MWSVGCILKKQEQTPSGYQGGGLGFITVFLQKKKTKTTILIYNHGSQIVFWEKSNNRWKTGG
jgi:hypothetical protein